MEEQTLTERESLQIITEMIQKVKPNVHTNGISAILWGTVVGIAGLVSFAEMQWDFDIHFDIWWIVLAALVPQVFLTIRERKNRKVVGYQEAAINAVWLVYGISIFALLFYFNVVQGATEKLLAAGGKEWLVKDLHTGTVQHLHPFVLSQSSLLLILYAIPTLVTGIAVKFKPMLAGAILCYIFFIISCFTSAMYDYLLNGLAGIACWLIPGIILYRRSLKATRC